MKTILSLLIILGAVTLAYSQNKFKTIQDQPFVQPQPLQVVQALNAGINPGRIAGHFPQNQLASLRPTDPAVLRTQILPSGSFWIDMKPNTLWQNRTSMTSVIDRVVNRAVQNVPWPMEWREVSRQLEDREVTHMRVIQTFAGYPIKGQDMILHIRQDELTAINGFAWTGILPDKLPDPVSADQAITAAYEWLSSNGVRVQKNASLQAIQIPDDTAELNWIPRNGKLILAYKTEMHPNALDFWTVYLEATTLEVMDAIAQKCAISPYASLGQIPSAKGESAEEVNGNNFDFATPVMDGATVTTDQDLLGLNRTVNAYQVGTNFFMIDASRSGMYKGNQSVMPNDPVGVIWTVDAQNSSPQQANFEVVHVTNTNNNWKSLEVSAHYNAGKAYEYFLGTFSRNSINGSGGNIISIINVTDENDNAMDNAFWNGSAMFYGNGNTAFKQLARGLDVAGHEMSHGVIQNTANLEYVGQSGALNESYADVFGSLIDRDDWQIGEDVVNTNVFHSGALRDLSNPNNGGSGYGDAGWQPKHMNEFVNLPNNAQNDNGGVHVNSGIPNRAFFLLASDVGREKAEKIYYKALTDYLVKSSQFVDMRLAAEKASVDLFGNNSAELDAVRHAFNTVGIGSGNGGDYEDDIETNNGDDFILATDESESDLYWVPPANPSQFVKMNVPAPISRPSFTDDGQACVYVDEDHNLIVIYFDWSNGLDFQAFYIEQNPQGIYRNIVVSKDGDRIAYTTSNLRNEINVYDFVSGFEVTYDLFNPTTANGGLSTGDVLYPDAMEWDYTGEYVMYDALNKIRSNFGDGIEYWDISFLRAWDAQTESFGSGQIEKLFTSLPESVSIGNPSFAKNSPYIITYDYLETYFDGFGSEQTDYYILASNIEAGYTNAIYQNTTVGYPSYSRQDDKILFTYDDNGNLLLGTIKTQPGNKTLPVNNTDVILITGAQKGVWFLTGTRQFNATEDLKTRLVSVHPQPATDQLFVDGTSVFAEADFMVTDMSGRQIANGVINEKAIQVSGLVPGIYLLSIREKDGHSYQARFVKQ